MKRTPGGAPLFLSSPHARHAVGDLGAFAEFRESITARSGRQAAESVLRLMEAVAKDERLGETQEIRAEWARDLSAALAVFVRPEFEVPDDLWSRYVGLNPIIANVLAGLGMTTDGHLLMVQGQRQEGFKSTVLHSPRNSFPVDLKRIFDANPVLGTAWLCKTIKTMYVGNAEKGVHERAMEILRQVEDRLVPVPDMHELYFLVSYFGDIEVERNVKRCINAAIRRNLDFECRNTPDPRKVAVWAEYWTPGHSVYRTLAGYVRSLREHFDEITLIHSVKPTEELDTSMFDKVIRLETDGFRIKHDQIRETPWSAVVFCDVGMTWPSLLVSNMRLAPQQILLTGHPSSTFGGEMDWFVSGDRVDENPSNYSEKLAIMPGFGCVHEIPRYTPTGRKNTTGELIVSMPSYGQKVHWEWLQCLNQKFRDIKRPVRLRIFAGDAVMAHKGLGAFARCLESVMTECHVEIVGHLPYEQYMAMLEEGDLTVDSRPYGGSNVVSDSIWLKKPTVSLGGPRWFSNVGRAMLDCLPIKRPMQTIELEVLLESDSERERYAAELRALDLKKTFVYSQEPAAAFGRFVRDRALGKLIAGRETKRGGFVYDVEGEEHE